jgi:hypothetical protein
MRMLDLEEKSAVCYLQLYLTVAEAQELQTELAKLLNYPETNEHSHVLSEDSGREFSCSIVTPRKMEGISSYSKLEQKVLLEK